MHILLNGETRKLPDRSTLRDLVEMLDLTGRRIAVEVNGEIVPRSTHGEHRLSEGDRVEIIHAVGGG